MKDIVHNLFTALLTKADKSPGKQVRLGKTEKPMNAYLTNDPVGIRETFHQEFKRLEAAGILGIKWHNPNILIQYIQLFDADNLAKQIGYRRLGNRFEHAKQLIKSQLTESPHLKAINDQLFSKWQSTGKFEGFSVDEPQDLVDAIRAADEMLALLKTEASEVDERHFSTRVFSDSKKLKSIQGKVARLIRLRDSEIPDELEYEEVFQLFGVVPMKHPIYVAGPITVVADNEKSVSVDFPPCVGLWPYHITSVKAHKPIAVITSIENFATYMRYVEQEKQGNEVVLYTAGIPSPAFRIFYKLLIQAFPKAPLRHWGDIDVGGFTILHILEKTASRPVNGYRMSSECFDSMSSHGKLSAAETSRLEKMALCMSCDNQDLVAAALTEGKKFEQEAFKQ